MANEVPFYLNPNVEPQAAPAIQVPVGGSQVSMNPMGDVAAQQVAAQQAALAQQQAMPQPQAPVVDPMQEALAQSQGLINQQKSINNTLGDAGAQKAQFEAEKQRELAKQYEQDLAQQQARAAQRQAEINNQLADIERTSQDYNKFLSSPEAKVKTNNLWENMGTGQKILAGISLALGALGSGNTGKNTAVDIITQAIDRDVDAQKNNIKLQAEGKLQNYNMSNNLYAQMQRKYQNEDQADAAVRLLRLQQVQAQMNAVASDYQGTQVKAQQKLANVALDQAILQQKQQFIAAAQQSAIMRELSGGTDMDKMAEFLPKDKQERYVPGYGIAANKESAQEFQKVRASLEPAINGAKSIQALLQDFNRVTDLKKKAQIQSEMKALAGQLRVPFTGPGALTEAEYERLMDTLGDPTSVTSMSSIQKAKLQQVLNKLNRDLDNSASQYGLPRKNKNIQLKTLGKPE